MVRHARQPPHSETQQHTTPVPSYKQQTDDNGLLRKPGPPGGRKLDGVRRCEYASRHASPVARRSSSHLTPTEKQPRWECLQDEASGLAPGPSATDSGG